MQKYLIAFSILIGGMVIFLESSFSSFLGWSVALFSILSTVLFLFFQRYFYLFTVSYFIFWVLVIISEWNEIRILTAISAFLAFIAVLVVSKKNSGGKMGERVSPENTGFPPE